MEIKRVGSQPSGKGPADWFTGTVRIDPLLTRDCPITRRFPSAFAVYPPAFPARRIRSA